MRLGGFQKFSLLDYPGKICSIVFTAGCNFRCGYCHNPELIDFKCESVISDEEIFSYLEFRKGKIDAVCITGGEPTLQTDLPEFMSKIKNMGFLLKLDTNGSNPEMLEKLVVHGLVDYIAMDIKAPILKYGGVINSSLDTFVIEKSIDLILKSSIAHEFRTTVVGSLHSVEDIIKISELIAGCDSYFIQKFVPSKVLDEKFLLENMPEDEFAKIEEALKSLQLKVFVR